MPLRGGGVPLPLPVPCGLLSPPGGPQCSLLALRDGAAQPCCTTAGVLLRPPLDRTPSVWPSRSLVPLRPAIGSPCRGGEALGPAVPPRRAAGPTRSPPAISERSDPRSVPDGALWTTHTGLAARRAPVLRAKSSGATRSSEAPHPGDNSPQLEREQLAGVLEKPSQLSPGPV